MALATTKQRLMASTRVSALSVSSCWRNSWRGSIWRRVAGSWGRERARAMEGDGVAFGRRVVFRWGVSVGWEDSVADMLRLMLGLSVTLL